MSFISMILMWFPINPSSLVSQNLTHTPAGQLSWQRSEERYASWDHSHRSPRQSLVEIIASTKATKNMGFVRSQTKYRGSITFNARSQFEDQNSLSSAPWLNTSKHTKMQAKKVYETLKNSEVAQWTNLTVIGHSSCIYPVHGTWFSPVFFYPLWFTKQWSMCRSCRSAARWISFFENPRAWWWNWSP